MTPEKRADKIMAAISSVSALSRRWNAQHEMIANQFHQAIRQARSEGFAKAREMGAATNEEWADSQTLKLHAGEMSAQETRTVIAVLKARAAAIRAMPEGDAP